MKNSALAPRLEKILRYGAHVWLFALIFSTFMAEALALALIGAWLALRHRQRTPLDFFIMLFLGIRLLTIVTAIAPATSMHALRKIPFLLVYFPLAHLAQRFGAREIHKLLRTLVIAGLAASGVGLLRTLITPVWRLASTTSGATTLATFLAVTFSLALTLILRNELQPARVWLSGCVMMLLALAFTRCRAPWLATLSVSGFMIKTVSRGVLALGAGAIIILLLVPGFGMRHAEVLHWPPDFGDRPIIWNAGWKAATQHPLLGYGPESFTLVFQSRHELKDKRAGAWHNFALQLLIESGVLGLAGFVMLMVQAFRITRSRFRAKLSSVDKHTSLALCAGLATLLCAGMFGGLIGDPLLDLLLWGMLGMISGLAASATSSRSALRGFVPIPFI